MSMSFLAAMCGAKWKALRKFLPLIAYGTAATTKKRHWLKVANVKRQTAPAIDLNGGLVGGQQGKRCRSGPAGLFWDDGNVKASVNQVVGA